MLVCCECCVLSGRGLCDELITRPEESYLSVVCLTEAYCEASMRRPWPTGGGVCCAMGKRKQILYFYSLSNQNSLLVSDLKKVSIKAETRHRL
jgi:hypothetical protein